MIRAKKFTTPTTQIPSKYSQVLNTKTTQNLLAAVQNRFLLPEKNKFLAIRN